MSGIPLARINSLNECNSEIGRALSPECSRSRTRRGGLSEQRHGFMRDQPRWPAHSARSPPLTSAARFDNLCGLGKLALTFFQLCAILYAPTVVSELAGCEMSPALDGIADMPG